VPTADLPLVRIQLRYPDEATFVQRFAANVTRGGIFLASRHTHPVGSLIRFEVALPQGPALLGGTGKVAWVREYIPAEPHRAHGMGVQFIQLDAGCKTMLDKLLEQKSAPTRPVTGEMSSPGPRRGPTSPGPQSNDGFLEGDPASWIDDRQVRMATDRARVLASRVDDVDSLRTRERDKPATKEEALAELPRLLGLRR
jgi:uncharacterized protein (TIGR02266 family)